MREDHQQLARDQHAYQAFYRGGLRQIERQVPEKTRQPAGRRIGEVFLGHDYPGPAGQEQAEQRRIQHRFMMSDHERFAGGKQRWVSAYPEPQRNAQN